MLKVGFTDGYHLPDASGYFQTRKSYYAYSNARDLFINFLPKAASNSLPKIDAQLMSLSRYAEIEWILHNRYELIYDGLNCMEVKEDLISAIKAGKNFRLSLLTEENTWHVTNVDLPFYVMSDNKFQFQTNIHWYPSFFDNLKGTENELIQKGFPERTAAGSEKIGYDMEFHAET